LADYPHHRTLVRRITVLFDPAQIPDLIDPLQVFVDNKDEFAAQALSNPGMERRYELVPTENGLSSQLKQLYVIANKSSHQSDVKKWSECFDTISKLKTLELLAFHVIGLAPVQRNSMMSSPEASQLMKTLPRLTTLEMSFSVKAQMCNHGVIESPVPIAAFSHAFQKCMILPSLSNLTIRELESAKFGDELFEFLAGFRTTLLYLQLEISEPHRG
jgi:hypothetical protein